MNDEFRQNVIQIADEFDLDEIESAKLFLKALANTDGSKRNPTVTCIINYHEQRQYILDCWRLILSQALDSDNNIEAGAVLKGVVNHVLELGNNSVVPGSDYWKKCITTMKSTESWIDHLSNRIQSISVIGQGTSEELSELLYFQRSSLYRQHESLSVITALLVKAGCSTTDDFLWLLPTLRSLDKHDINLLHFYLVTSSLISFFGPADGSCSFHDAKALNNAIIGSRETEVWAHRSFHAAVIAFWTAEYSGRFADTTNVQIAENCDDQGSDSRENIFFESLKDGAFHFILSVNQDVRPSDWYDPVKEALSSLLLQDCSRLPSEISFHAEYFQICLMEQTQCFIENVITNMPDTLRRMKLEEDDNRRLQHSRFQRHHRELNLHLERFLIIISYAFDCALEASDAFWSDVDGNLYGFLQWMARRQTTPRVATFCEMFRSISQGEQCAGAAHKFLLDEKASGMEKVKRKASISWSQILAEIQLYAVNGKDKQMSTNGLNQQSVLLVGEQVIESESSLMLQSYLRLLAHLSKESPIARKWLLEQSSHSLLEMILQLASSGVESRLRANCFLALTALLTAKNRILNEELWNFLDNWLWDVSSSSISAIRNETIPISDINIKNNLLESIAMDFESSASFIGLLQALISSNADDPPVNDSLPFPENLGATYRMPGIEDYVDFVIGDVFASKMHDTPVGLKRNLLRWNCLQFMATALSSFHENLFLLADFSQISVDDTAEKSHMINYVRLHPFARVMEWFYNDKVVDSLFAAAHCAIDEVNDAEPNSPLIASLVKCIEVMDLVMKFQPTYIDVVRPFLKSQYPSRKIVAANLASTCFEDSLLNHLQIIVDLGLYCGTGHQDLTVQSLQLLERLSSSRRLEVSSLSRFGNASNQSRVISAVQQDGNSELIARSLSLEMKLEDRDVEAGQDSPGTNIKTNVLKLLKGSLLSSSNRPTLAHLLLGFSCEPFTLDVKETGLFASGDSLFHAIIRLLLDCYRQEKHGFIPWISTMKQLCFDILQKLWRSPLSTDFVTKELRVNQFLPLIAQYQISLDPFLILDEGAIFKAELLLTEASNGLRLHLLQRSAFFEYAAHELRFAMKYNLPSLKSQILSYIVGSVDRSEVSETQNVLVLNLFEFADLEITDDELMPPQVGYLCSMDDLNAFRSTYQNHGNLYNISAVEGFLALRLQSLRKLEPAYASGNEQELISEVEIILIHIVASNKFCLISEAFRSTLKNWVLLMSIILKSFEPEPMNSSPFILQTIQAISMKLEKANARSIFVALELAGLMRNVLQCVKLAYSQNNGTQNLNVINDRLFQVFRVALGGMTSSITRSELREIYYQICYRYLRWLSQESAYIYQMKRQVLRCVKAHGEQVIEIFVDDVVTGEGVCKISSLLLLEALLHIEQREQPAHILENVINLNFIPVLLDDIRNMPIELGEAKAIGEYK